MKNLLLISSLSVLFVACAGEDRTLIDKMEQELFVVHDEIMPKMDKLMELQETVSQEIAEADSLLKLKPNAELGKRKLEGLAVSEKLRDADKGMMDWMHEYKGDTLKTLKVEAALGYLNAEKIKINAVRDKMLEALTQAEKFTGENP